MLNHSLPEFGEFRYFNGKRYVREKEFTGADADKNAELAAQLKAELKQQSKRVRVIKNQYGSSAVYSYEQ